MKLKRTFPLAPFIMGVFILLAVLPKSTRAQTIPSILWTNTFGGSNIDGVSIDVGYYSIIQTFPDSGYILISATNSNDGNVAGNHGLKDVWVIKMDKLGNVIWKHCYGGTNNDEGHWIIQTKDRGFLFAASTLSNNANVSFNHGLSDIWIVKLDSIGNIMWEKTYGGTINEYVFSLEACIDGSGYVFIGQIGSSNTGNVVGAIHGTDGYPDGWVVKIDTIGNIIWQHSFGGSNWETFMSLVTTTDGGYAVCGYTRSNDGDVIGNHGDYDYWIVKLNSAGNIDWQKCYGGTYEERASSIKQTFDGGYIVNGYTSSHDGDVTYNHNNSPSTDVWALRLNSVGLISWQKSYGGTSLDKGYCVLQKSDTSGFVLCNTANSNTSYDVSAGYGADDVWIVMVDNFGNIQSKKSFGGTQFEITPTIIQSRDKGYVFLCSTKSNDGNVAGNHGISDIWVVKLLNSSGTLPINLLSFKAKKMKDKVELSWKTSSEINNNYFTIEKSIDGYMYQEIGRVSGAGNSSQILNYSFFDDNPFRGVTYYRLSQTDYNGESETFPVVAIEFNDSKPVVKTILYNIQGLEVEDNDYLDSGIYFRISYDMDGNIIGQNKFFK